MIVKTMKEAGWEESGDSTEPFMIEIDVDSAEEYEDRDAEVKMSICNISMCEDIPENTEGPLALFLFGPVTWEQLDLVKKAISKAEELWRK